MNPSADAGRAPTDRTSLSWQRTTLHAALLALVAAVTSLQLGEPAVGIVAAVLAGGAVVVGARTPRVRRHELDVRDLWWQMVRTVVVLSAAGLVAVMLIIAVALER
jgi:amino acid permease